MFPKNGSLSTVESIDIGHYHKNYIFFPVFSLLKFFSTLFSVWCSPPALSIKKVNIEGTVFMKPVAAHLFMQISKNACTWAAAARGKQIFVCSTAPARPSEPSLHP